MARRYTLRKRRQFMIKKLRKKRIKRLVDKQGVLMFLIEFANGKEREKLQDKIDKIERKLKRR